MIDISKLNLCINCKHYMALEEGREVCGYFITVDQVSLVNGEIYGHRCVPCQSARTENNKCGKDGVHFERRESAPEKITNDKITGVVNNVVNNEEQKSKKKNHIVVDSTGLLTDPK